MEPKAVTTHLAKGSSAPAPVGGSDVRLYTFEFCPHGQRIRLLLSAKNIPHDIVYVNPKSVPEWYTQRNTTGRLPGIEHKGSLIIESAIICEYLEEVYTAKKMHQSDLVQKAYDRILLQNFSTKVGQNMAYLVKNKDATDKEQRIAEATEVLVHFENQLIKRGTPFYAGNQPGMLDYSIWPWLERIEALSKIYGNTLELAKEKFPNLRAWWQKIVEDPSVKISFRSSEEHLDYIQKELQGQAVYA
ncbi:glutathione S-transferase omega-1-like [Artemia franciscana]|uniref:glutathione S-transferase omega-1-like n=1 Tax=Artemia franciscana TaxID=6661 RepID=UPI0032DA0CF5